MATTDRQALVRRFFETFRAADREAFEAMITPDFTFTSPYDDHIDRATYFERCWPLAGTFESHELSLVLVEGNDAVVHYDGRSKNGNAFRNVERFTFEGDRVRAVEVFFGLPQGAAAESPEHAIRTVLEQRQEALRLKDARLVSAKHAPDAVMFTLAPPLVTEGDPESDLAAWFRTWRTLLDWEMRDTKINVSGDIAFVTALEHMSGTKADGEDVDLWVRTTLGLRKINGEWKITHEHQSVPFEMDGSFKAAVDLQPPAPMH